MSDSLKHGFKLPPEQQAIRDRCFHPSGTFVEFPTEDVETSIPARFEKIVRMYPERLAINYQDRSLSYEALNQFANRIARAILAARGHGSEPISLLFEYGVDVIAALLGILKAGKFYFALDPTFPSERNTFILEDTGARLIVTNDLNARLATELAKKVGVPIIDVDHISGVSNSENLGFSVSPEDVMTISYTSGSTGKPKGVIETNRFRMHNAMLHSNAVRVCTKDKLSLIHAVSFQTTQINLFRALLNGACVLPFDIKFEGNERFVKWLKEQQITILHSPVAAFRRFAQSLTAAEKFPHLRVIHLSGAPITQVEYQLYKSNFPRETLLFYHLGAAEAGGVCRGFLEHSFCYPKEGTPAGYVWPDKKVLLLKEDGEEVIFGEVGEIAVESRYLALGYWNQPEITGTKFLAGPNGGDERIYLTGDLGRMLSDGFVIHHGRKDFMVKIRGYRVEITEIESALLAHSNVSEAAVVAWDSGAEQKYLAAYIVSQNPPCPTVDELRGFLTRKLPDYMIPSAFVFLDSLPLTNGKLDRKALPKLEGKRPELRQAYVAPQGTVEQTLVQIWEEVLNVRPIGVHDNFFDLGGHSLAASRVVSRVLIKFQLDIPLRSLFESPTVAGLVEVIETLRWLKMGPERSGEDVANDEETGEL